jgi:hypothetical protein
MGKRETLSEKNKQEINYWIQTLAFSAIVFLFLLICFIIEFIRGDIKFWFLLVIILLTVPILLFVFLISIYEIGKLKCKVSSDGSVIDKYRKKDIIVLLTSLIFIWVIALGNMIFEFLTYHETNFPLWYLITLDVLFLISLSSASFLVVDKIKFLRKKLDYTDGNINNIKYRNTIFLILLSQTLFITLFFCGSFYFVN